MQKENQAGQRKRRPGLVTNNIPHTIYSGGNLLVNCIDGRCEKKLTSSST